MLINIKYVYKKIEIQFYTNEADVLVYFCINSCILGSRDRAQRLGVVTAFAMDTDLVP